MDFILKIAAKFLGASWRTSLLGILTILGAVGNYGTALLDNDPATVADWKTTSAVVAVGLGLLAARDNKVSSEEAKGNGGNFPGGIVKILVLGGGLLLTSRHPSVAQDTTILNAVPPATIAETAAALPGNWFVDGFKAASSYLGTYGEQRAGVGGTIASLKDGEFDAVLIQQVSLPPLTTNLKGWKLEHSFGLVHTTTFSGEQNHEGVGLGISWRLLKIKPVAGVSLPTIGDLSELRLGLSISSDVDKAIDRIFGSRWTVCAVTAGWSF